jgi:hypothetical protein
MSGGVVLDVGAFVALERKNRVMVALARRFIAEETPLVTSAGVVARVWSGSRAQAPVAFLLRRTKVVELGNAVARLLGRMLRASGGSDLVAAHVAFLAREHGWPVLTSTPEAVRAVDPSVRIERI